MVDRTASAPSAPQQRVARRLWEQHLPFMPSTRAPTGRLEGIDDEVAQLALSHRRDPHQVDTGLERIDAARRLVRIELRQVPAAASPCAALRALLRRDNGAWPRGAASSTAGRPACSQAWPRRRGPQVGAQQHPAQAQYAQRRDEKPPAASIAAEGAAPPASAAAPPPPRRGRPPGRQLAHRDVVAQRRETAGVDLDTWHRPAKPEVGVGTISPMPEAVAPTSTTLLAQRSRWHARPARIST